MGEQWPVLVSERMTETWNSSTWGRNVLEWGQNCASHTDWSGTVWALIPFPDGWMDWTEHS